MRVKLGSDIADGYTNDPRGRSDRSVYLCSFRASDPLSLYDSIGFFLFVWMFDCIGFGGNGRNLGFFIFGNICVVLLSVVTSTCW